MTNNLYYKLIKPDKSLADFVYCFSSLQNLSVINEAVIIPNGKIDLIFSKTADNQLQISLLGLETKPKQTHIDVIEFFAVSFNPLAIEYIFNASVADIINTGKHLPNTFWDFSIEDLTDFDAFQKKVLKKIQSLVPKEVDERKRSLFELIFATNG